MRRTSTHEISSLDMLLDTMCNTFGGIVFIALLLSILSGAIGRQDAESRETKTEALGTVEQNIEVAKLSRERDELEAAVRHMTVGIQKGRDRLPPQVINLDAVAESNRVLAAEVGALDVTNRAIILALSKCEERIEAERVAAAELAAMIPQLDQDLRRKRTESEKTRKVRLPRLHSVGDKRGVFFCVKDGRFFAVSDVSGKKQTRPRPYDSQDSSVESGPGMDVVEVRQGAGQPIRSGCEMAGKLAQALRNLDSDNEFPDFSVHPNSFAEFNYVKQLFVRRGFSYNWRPTEGALQIVQTDEPLEAQ